MRRCLPPPGPPAKDVLKTYADIAEAAYANSLDTARTLKLAIDALLAKPTEDNLRAARGAWIAARIPYMQTEAYRFGNAIVDDWEGKVNAWPLDEGLIDYVASAYGAQPPENELYAANVIANAKLTIGGKTLEASKSRQSCSPTRCKRPAASRPMSPRAITRSNFFFGARI